jgi:hypothetical protein
MACLFEYLKLSKGRGLLKPLTTWHKRYNNMPALSRYFLYIEKNIFGCKVVWFNKIFFLIPERH